MRPATRRRGGWRGVAGLSEVHAQAWQRSSIPGRTGRRRVIGSRSFRSVPESQVRIHAVSFSPGRPGTARGRPLRNRRRQPRAARRRTGELVRTMTGVPRPSILGRPGREKVSSRPASHLPAPSRYPTQVPPIAGRHSGGTCFRRSSPRSLWACVGPVSHIVHPSPTTAEGQGGRDGRWRTETERSGRKRSGAVFGSKSVSLTPRMGANRLLNRECGGGLRRGAVRDRAQLPSTNRPLR